MPEVIETQETVFDAAAHIKQRNEALEAQRQGKPPEVPKPEVKAETKTEILEPKPEEDHARLLRKRERRELNRLRLELGEARGRLSAYEELKPAPQKIEAKPEDPEPNPSAFTTDAEYQRALARWEGRQEARKELGKRDEQNKTERERAASNAHVLEMDAKYAEDVKSIKDWDEVAKAVQEDPGAPTFDPSEQKLLWGLIAHSDVRAFMLHHFAKKPADFQKVIDLQDDPNGQIALFKRLEGRVETMYSNSSNTEVVQASDKSKDESKQRTAHPAEAAKPAGRNTSERDAHKPRPSSEVAARGGSAPPEEPEIGSAAWMARRNQVTGGR